MLRFLATLLLPAALLAQSRRPILGDTRPVPANLQGTWTNNIWRAEIRSTGAAGLRLHFTDFYVNRGKVRVGEDPQVFSGGGLFRDGDFWSPTHPGDSITVQYEPLESDTTHIIPFHIKELAHFYPPTVDKDKDRSLVAGCHVDLATQPAWQTAGQSVALMVFQTSESGLQFWTTCTGTLIADKNRTNRALFLTAHHCIHTDDEARSLETYWDFQTTTPGSLPYNLGFRDGAWNPATLPATLQRVVGSRVLLTTSESEGDGTLLELSAPAPADARFATINPVDIPPGAITGTVHHPDGSWKRIASGPRALPASGNEVDIQIDRKFRPSDYYYKIEELLGLTDFGSSGAALLTTDNLVSGTLSYGPTPACNEPDRHGIYGRSTHFFPRLQPILNNMAPGACTANITAVNQWLSSSGGEVTFLINAPAGCYWGVAADDDHIEVNVRSGSGNGAVVYQVSANTDPNFATTGRVGTLSVITEERRVVHIMQRGTDLTQIYSDVTSAHPFVEEINYLQRRSVQAYGCAEPGGFCPDASTTRGQMAEFIIRSLFNGTNFTFASTPYFTDVVLGNPSFPYVQKMKELQITDGCTTTTYCPDDPVTRGQMAAFIIRAVQYRNNQDSRAGFTYSASPYFTDATVNNSIFFNYIQKMKELGITSGCDITVYCGDAPNTRGQIAVFLTRGIFGLYEGRFH